MCDSTCTTAGDTMHNGHSRRALLAWLAIDL